MKKKVLIALMTAVMTVSAGSAVFASSAGKSNSGSQAGQVEAMANGKESSDSITADLTAHTWEEETASDKKSITFNADGTGSYKITGSDKKVKEEAFTWILKGGKVTVAQDNIKWEIEYVNKDGQSSLVCDEEGFDKFVLTPAKK